ncbi:MAG: 16S rRNA (uracil(1498)-N(3))-methyltransferase [bacterium]
MRYFVVPQRVQQKVIHFTQDQMHHMRKVIRFKPGDNVECFDNRGYLYRVELKKISKDSTYGKIIETIETNDANERKITILQAYPSALPKLDIVVEKCTEIGAHAFILFKSKRSELMVQPSEEKISRWKKIAIKASEQSLRTSVPEIYTIDKFSDLDFSEYDAKILLYEKSENINWPDETQTAKNIIVVIGPEGGWEPNEVEEITKEGFVDCKPFKNILRTETAPIAACAILA